MLPSITQLKRTVGRLVGKVSQRPEVRQYFQPTSQVRARDVAREAFSPQTRQTMRNLVNKSANQVMDSGKTITNGLAKTKYFEPKAGPVRTRDFVRELPTGIVETAKMLTQAPVRAAISAKEVPEIIRNKGVAPGKFYNTPVGRLNSVQSEQQNRLARGDSQLKATGGAVVDTILGAADFASFAKPTLEALKAGKRIPGELKNLAGDLLSPVTKDGIKFSEGVRESIPAHNQKGRVLPVTFRDDGDHVLPELDKGEQFVGKIINGGVDEVTGDPKLYIRTERPVPEQVVERGGYEPQSATLQSLMRPGLTIKEDFGTMPQLEPRIDDFPLLSGRTPIKGVNDQRASEIKTADALLGRTGTLPDGSPMKAPDAPLALPEVKMTGLGQVEEALTGNRAAEFDDSGKQMSFTLRKLQNFGDELAAAGLQSESGLFRGISNTLRGFAGGLGKSDELVSNISKLQGTQEYGLKLQSDLNDGMFKGLLGGNVDSLRKIHRVLDPEAYTGQPMPDLSDAEQQAAGTLRLISDFINDNNYQKGFISQENWLKNRGGKYIMRAYNWEEDLPEETKRFFEKNRFKLDIGGYMKRDELTDEMKNALSQDPIYLVGTRLRQTVANSALHEFATEIKNDANLVSDVARKGYTQLSDHKAFGELAGKYVRKDVVESINGLYFTNKVMDAGYGLLRMYDNFGARRGMKKWLTVYNPAVRIGNNVSSLWFANNIGINPLSFTKQFAQERAMGSIKNNDPLYLKMMKDGIVGSNMTSELVDATAATRDEIMRMADPSKARQVWNTIKAVDKSITGSYGRVDDYAKLAAMKILLKRGWAYPEAARQVSRGFQNYRNVGWLWDVSSKMPVMGKAFGRFIGNMVQMEANAWVDRPIRKAATYGMLAMFAEGMSMLSGETEEDQATRESRSWFPRLLGTSIPAAIQTPGGEINFSRWLPASSSSPSGADETATDLNKISPFVSPVTMKDGNFEYNPAAHTGDPLTAPALSLILDKDFRGKSIKDPDQNPYVGSILTPEEKLMNQGEFVRRSVSGGFLNTLSDVKSTAETGKDYYGRERTPGQAAANLAGLKIEKYGPEQAQASRDKSALYEAKGNERAEDKINSIQKAFRNGEITEEQANARVKYQQSLMKKGGNEGSVSTQGFASAYGYEDILAPKGSTNTLKGALAETKRKSALTKLYLDDTVSDEMKQRIFTDAKVDMNELEKQVLKSESIAPEFRASLIHTQLQTADTAKLQEFVRDEILTYGVIDNMYQEGLISEAQRWAARDYVKKYKTQIGLLKGSSGGGKKPKMKAPKITTELKTFNKNTAKPRSTASYKRAVKTPNFEPIKIKPPKI